MKKLEVLNGIVTGKDETGKKITYRKGDFINVPDEQVPSLLATRNFRDVTEAIEATETPKDTVIDQDALEDLDETGATTVNIKKQKK